MSRRSSFFLISYREAKGAAIIVATLGWLAVVAFVGLGAGDRSAFGPLKWADFVHFYTLGDVARTRQGGLLFDSSRLHVRQSSLVPASKADGFVPVYGPQTALIFAPLSVFPYLVAGTLWALLTVWIYAWAVWLSWRPIRQALPDRVFLIAATMAFPPVWQLVIYGQTTAVLLLAFAGGLWGLERNRPLLAGIALSLISVKPQWCLVLAVIAILGRDGRVLAGMLIGISIQVAAVIAVFDVSVLPAYAEAIRGIPRVSALLEPDAYKMHSYRALTRLFPPPLDWGVWGAVAAITVWRSAQVWRDRSHPWRVRFGVLIIASALVNPHLTVYDVTVLVLPLLWIGGWLLAQPRDSTWFWQRCCWLSVALLVPTARVIPVQATPILLAELLFRLDRIVRSAPATPGNGDRKYDGYPRASSQR